MSEIKLSKYWSEQLIETTEHMYTKFFVFNNGTLVLDDNCSIMTTGNSIMHIRNWMINLTVD